MMPNLETIGARERALLEEISFLRTKVKQLEYEKFELIVDFIKHSERMWGNLLKAMGLRW